MTSGSTRKRCAGGCADLLVGHLVVVGVVVGELDAVLELRADEHVGDELVASARAGKS
jgi:hypothetical protein